MNSVFSWFSPAKMQDLVSVEFSHGLAFDKIWEGSRPPPQFTSTAPASAECELYVTAIAGSGSYTLSVTIEA